MLKLIKILVNAKYIISNLQIMKRTRKQHENKEAADPVLGSEK